MSRHGLFPALALVALLALAAAPGLSAGQSTLERTPNVDGFWAPRPGVVQFNFNHRFHVTGPPARKLLNTPTLVVATGLPGLPGGAVVGSRYASNSLLVTGQPNEWEVFGRWSPWRESAGRVADVGLHIAHNGRAGGVDGELLVGRGVGPVQLMAGGRAFSSFRGGEGEFAVVGGVVVRLGRHVALAADAAELVGVDGDVAWSGGLHFEIPYTPHSMSLHVSNVNATTLQSATVATPDRRWGFEFTVPITLRRYVGGGDRPRAVVSAAGSEPVGATVDMDNLMRFLPDTVTVGVGESVRWRNTSDIVHTVTADASRAELPASVRLPAGAAPFDSGDMRPGEEFVHVFTEPGEYVYFCVPHERVGMIGVVRVEAR